MVDINEQSKQTQITNLKEVIANAEKTIQEARSMLIRLQGYAEEQTEQGTVILGTFDGQIMIGDDQKQYPVPANYASKSKLIEGDRLKLTITTDGTFIYKQVGPADRKNVIGIASQDENGNFHILADGKAYKVLLASITYFKVNPGDEVVIVTPRNINSSWASIESVLRKGGSSSSFTPQPQRENIVNTEKPGTIHGIEIIDTADEESQSTVTPITTEINPDDQWLKDIEDMKRELKEEIEQNRVKSSL